MEKPIYKTTAFLREISNYIRATCKDQRVLEILQSCHFMVAQSIVTFKIPMFVELLIESDPRR